MRKSQFLVLMGMLSGCGDDATTPGGSPSSSGGATTGSTSASAETSASVPPGSGATSSAVDTASAVDTSDPDSSSGPGVFPGEILEVELEVGGFVFDARVTGPDDGELVLLLHGFPQSSFEWRHQLTALGEAGYRAVAPDQRGYSPGARPAEVDDYAYSQLVGDVLDIADELGAETFHLVGHDWGAAVAWGVAAQAPARITTLTAASIPHIDAINAQLADMTSCQYEAVSYFDFFVTPESTAALLADDAAGLRNVYQGLDEDTIDQYVAQLGTEPALDAALNWYRANLVERRLGDALIGTITVPTMFLWSDADPTVCVESAEATADFVTGSYRFEVFEGIGHWIPELASEDVSARLLEHLAQSR